MTLHKCELAFALENEIVELQRNLHRVRLDFVKEARTKGYSYVQIGKALGLSDRHVGTLVNHEPGPTRVSKGTLMQPPSRLFNRLPDRKYKPVWAAE